MIVVVRHCYIFKPCKANLARNPASNGIAGKEKERGLVLIGLRLNTADSLKFQSNIQVKYIDIFFSGYYQVLFLFAILFIFHGIIPCESRAQTLLAKMFFD
jgi:hypothetical protein